MADANHAFANAMLDVIDTDFPAGSILEVYSGSAPANADTAISGQTLLASITLPSSPWAAASSSSKAKQNTWQDASADGGAGATPTFCRLKNSGDTKRIDLTAGIGSGEVQFNGTITAGQTVTVSSLTLSV